MALLIKKEGIFTSLQDLGRYGQRRLGIPPRGAMDRIAARIVNLLAGNNEGARVLEIHFPGPEIVFEQECVFALGGADLAAELDGRPIPNWLCCTARRSGILKFRQKMSGNRCYLAVYGGLRLGPDDQSNAFATERLQADQKLFLDAFETFPAAINRRVSPNILPAYSPFPTVRVVIGAEFLSLSSDDKRLFGTVEFKISADSNRMGFRLAGPTLTSANIAEMVSAAVNFGTIQLMPDGQLIVLMADHQTSGGYPRVGHVISADLSLVAQLGPGDKIAFRIVDIAEAEHANARLETDLNKLKMGIKFGRYW